MSPHLILLFLTPFITATIGWFTNWLAIKMLFNPRKPVNLFFVKWQGLIPKRQQQLANESAEIIERIVCIGDINANIATQLKLSVLVVKVGFAALVAKNKLICQWRQLKKKIVERKITFGKIIHLS